MPGLFPSFDIGKEILFEMIYVGIVGADKKISLSPADVTEARQILA